MSYVSGKPLVAGKVAQASITASGAASDALATPDQPPGVPLPGLTGAVNRVTIEFELFSGADRQLMGAGRHLYVADDAGNYGVTINPLLKAEDPAPAATWLVSISGTISMQGLSPILFRVRGALSERLVALDGGGRPSTLPSRPRNARMPDGLLDRQSLLYQFMVQPPELTGGELWLSDGVSHGLYTYRLAGIESFNIPSRGGVSTIKLVLSTRDSPEIVELWLIPDLHYLPAKVRYTDRQGMVTEQVVISLDFS